MQIERWDITDREEWLARRKANINASEIGALFGCSPLLTPYALYAAKAGLATFQDDDNAAMKRGRVLEPAIAQAIREDYPDWKLENYGAYLWCQERRLGCTPDFKVVVPTRGSGVIQGKSVAGPYFDEHWQDGPPQWIVLQTLQEMMLAEVQWGAIAAFVIRMFDYELHVFPFKRHAAAEEKIIRSAGRFWEDIANEREPALDYARDGEIIKTIYARDSGETIDLSGDARMAVLLDLREELSKRKTDAEKELKTINAEIAAKMRNAAYAIVPGWEKVSFKTQTRKGYIVEDTSYRVLRAKRATTETRIS